MFAHTPIVARMFVLAAAAATAVVLALGAPVAGAAKGCTAQFEGTVVNGPDAGLTLSGPLDLAIAADGTVTGTLTDDTRGRVPVTGTLRGESLHLTFDLGNGSIVRGAGALDGVDFAGCTGTATGSLQGPNNGDTGNWGIIWGS